MPATQVPRSPSARPPQTVHDLTIAGLSRFSSVDWPGHLVATVFLQGCPWDCLYCHNPDLIDPRVAGSIAWRDVEALLDTRRGMLDGVVFSGGEPTRQRALVDAIARVRARGFAVGLHTGGAYPTQLTALLDGLDWIGLDVKALPDEYAATTGRGPSGAAAIRALDLVIEAQRARAGTDRPLDLEVRTTVHPDLIDDERLVRLGHLLADRGVTHWAVQRFRATGARCGEPAGTPLRLDRLPRERFVSVVVR